MAEHVTDEQVASERKRVEDLRNEIAAERARQASSTRSEENAYRKAALSAEAERYERELAAMRGQGGQPAQPTPPQPAPQPTPPQTAPKADEKDKE